MNQVTVIVQWDNAWLNLTKVSPELFYQYLIKYGIPQFFEISNNQGDFKYAQAKTSDVGHT